MENPTVFENNQIEENIRIKIENELKLPAIYRIESGPEKGGMGEVYKVLHTDWKLCLAMKRPQAKYFETEQQKANFTKECNRWFDLGLHPHIVSCYYVKRIGEIPSIFAEWMEGGSLRQAIKRKTLYKGNDKEIQERLLNISIQVARGLHYANRKGLIHRDIKPDNLLFDADGTLKVTDFGISSAKTQISFTSAETDSSGSKFVSTIAYTRAYCSPEQREKSGDKLTCRTDIWSWAITVLEMYLYGLPEKWTNGAEAGKLCEEYFKSAKIQIPEVMKDLMRWCFRKEEDDRPQDFGVIENELLKIYETELDRTYTRSEPKEIDLEADSLNNKGISYIDLGMPEKAEECWDQALTIAPNHAESLYNRSVYLWKNCRIDDVKAVYSLSKNPSENSDYYIAKLHLARKDAESAIEFLYKAKETHGETDDIQRMFAEANDMIHKGIDGKCIHTFKGHTGGVNSVNFSPDGKTAISGSGDKTIKLWEVATGRIIHSCMKHSDNVKSVSFSPDGETAISGSWDCTLRLWEVATGKCIRQFSGYSLPVNSDYISRNGIFSILLRFCNELFEIVMNWLQRYVIIIMLRSFDNSVCFSPDGKTVVWVKSRNKITLLDISTGKSIHSFKGRFSEDLCSVRFSPDGKAVISGSNDNTIKLWEITNSRCIRRFEGHSHFVETVCFSPDGKTIISGSKDYKLKLWDVMTGQCIRTFIGHTDAVLSVGFSPDGKTVISGSEDNSIKLWQVATGLCIRTFEGHSQSVEAVCFSPDGKTILSGSRDCNLKSWSVIKTDNLNFEMAISKVVATEKALYNKELFKTMVVDTISLTKKGDINGALYNLSKLTEFQKFGNSETYNQLKNDVGRYCVFKKLTKYKSLISQNINDRFSSADGSNISCVSFSPDGKSMISAKKGNNSVELRDVASLELIGKMSASYHEIESIDFSPDGNTVVSGSKNNSIKLWDVTTKQCFRTYEGNIFRTINFIKFSPDGKTLIIGYYKILKLMDVETMQVIRTFKKHKNWIYSVSFSPDGKTVASGSSDGTLKLWEVSTGDCINIFKEQSIVLSVCFSPDGKTVISGNHDGTLTLWDLALYRRIHTFRGHSAIVYSVCFSPDGKTVVSGSGDKTLKLWNVISGHCLHTFEGFSWGVSTVCFSPDGTKIVLKDKDNITIIDLEHDLYFPGWHGWDEDARPYLDIFLALYPNWSEEEYFNILIPSLQNSGYGWLRPEGVRVELEKMTRRYAQRKLFFMQNQY